MGTTTTLHSSTGEEKDSQDETRLKEDVLKMLQLIYVKPHAVQAALQQRPSSQLMKHMVKGSWGETKSHFWHGRSDGVMWEWILCKWYTLPFCGFGIISKKFTAWILSLNISRSSHAKSQKEPMKRTQQCFLCFCVHACYYYSSSSLFTYCTQMAKLRSGVEAV